MTSIRHPFAEPVAARPPARSTLAIDASAPVDMISGTALRFAITRMWARVAWLALRMYANPARALGALRLLRAAQSPYRHSMPHKAPAVSGRLFPSLYLPGWPSKAFDRCVERELDRVLPVLGRPSALRVAVVAMTRMCALRCEHCFEWDVLNHHEGLSADALRRIVMQLRWRGVAQVFFSGGEPLQRFDVLLDLVAEVGDESDVWVLSSGRGLTREKAARLREAGITGVSLSLDHWNPVAHDAFRGRAGAFEAVQRAAREVREAGLVLALSLCPVRDFVSDNNLRRYAEVARSLGASFIQLFEPRAVGHYAGKDVALDPVQQQTLESFVTWLNLDPAVRGFPVAIYMEREARNGGCRGGGEEYAYVDTEGALHPCPFCREHPVSLAGRDLDEALIELRAAGCPAQDNYCMARSST